MDAKELQKYVDIITQGANRYNTQKAYAIGNNTAILQPFPKPSPDNRKPVPFARKSIALIKGYMAKPGNIVYSGDYYENFLKEIYHENDEELITANELEDALRHGVTYEIHWLEEGKGKQFYNIPVDQGHPIYDTKIKPNLIGFVWYRKTGDNVETASYYDDVEMQDWTRTSGGQWIGMEPVAHGYGTVPVNVGQIDRDKRNIFDHVLPLIDLYDKLMSEDVGNELERFNAAILAMAERIDTASTDDYGRTMIDRLKELRLIDGLGDGDVKQKMAFITRDIPTAFLEFSAKTIERLIYEMLMIPNPNDDNFAAASGIAQAYKLLAMEYLCAGIEAYFSRFLQNRIKIISGISGELGESTDGIDDVNIRFTRNLPLNLKEAAETAAMLKGIVSDETVLKLFPASFIDSVEDEMERMGVEDDAPDIMDEPVGDTEE
jgi:SPP1 family phage portal protein